MRGPHGFGRVRRGQRRRRYTKLLTEFVDDHSTVVTLLAKGVKESRRHMDSAAAINGFLDRTMESRIGIRLLIEHQIALQNPREGFIGVIRRGGPRGARGRGRLLIREALHDLLLHGR